MVCCWDEIVRFGKNRKKAGKSPVMRHVKINKIWRCFFLKLGETENKDYLRNKNEIVS